MHDSFKTLDRSLIYRANDKGPVIDPRELLTVFGLESEIASLISSFWNLSVK